MLRGAMKVRYDLWMAKLVNGRFGPVASGKFSTPSKTQVFERVSGGRGEHGPCELDLLTVEERWTVYHPEGQLIMRSPRRINIFQIWYMKPQDSPKFGCRLVLERGTAHSDESQTRADDRNRGI